MKPFDLAAAKRGDPICTRDGRKAAFIGIAPSDLGDTQPVVAWIEDVVGPDSFTPEGHYYLDGESVDDLFMAPQKSHGYLIVWRNGSLIEAAVFLTEAGCNEHRDFLCDKGHTVLTYGQRIEWEE